MPEHGKRHLHAMRLLIVCLGNICRSPMAQGVLHARIAASPLAGRVAVDSCGIGRWHAGQAPDSRAVATALRHGVDIAGQRARQLADEDFARHHWLLCADRENLRDVRRRCPASMHARTALLLEWAGMGEGDIPDPYTGGAAEFEHVWTLLDRAAQGAIQRLSMELAGA